MVYKLARARLHLGYGTPAYLQALFLCSLSWRAIAHEDDMPLSITSEHLREMHAEYDHNKDDGISREELLDFVSSYHDDVALGQNDPATMLKTMDTSLDGVVSLDEHLKATTKMDEASIHCNATLCHNGLEENRDYMKQKIRDETELFRAADKNQDGVLDVGEISDLAAPRMVGSIMKVIVNQSMNVADRNGDGRLNREEFDHRRKRQRRKGQLGNLGAMDFSKIDANSDGFIDNHELQALETGQLHMKKLVDDMVLNLDVNGDDRIDIAELVHGKNEVLDSELQAYLIAWAHKRSSLKLSKQVVV